MTGSDKPLGFSLVNGRQQDVIPVADRGLSYGDGLFETMRCRGGNMPAWSLHRQRLVQGCELLGFAVDLETVESELKTIVALASKAGIDDSVIKIIITRGQGGRGYLPPDEPLLNRIFQVRPYSALNTPAGRAVTLQDCLYKLSHNPTLAGVKHLNRLEQVLAGQSVALSPGAQGLVFDLHDRAIETLHHNLFLIIDNALVTPDLSNCGVAGVLRRAIIDTFAPAIGVGCIIRDISRADFGKAAEVFICNSVHGISPVNEWQELRWETGPVTQHLIQSIASCWKGVYDC